MWSQKWHEELGELSLEHSKSEKVFTDGLFFSKAYNISVTKLQRDYVSWHWRMMQNLKFVSVIFIKCLFFHQMIAFQKLWKMLFVSYKKLFSFSRYSKFCISVLPSFSTCLPLIWRMIIICVTKNSITHFVWYLEKEERYDIETLSTEGVSDKEHLYRKIMQITCSKASPRPLYNFGK